MSDALARARALGEAAGFELAGGVAFDAGEGPALGGGGRARALILYAGGAGLWNAFSASPEFAAAAADPLDRWTRRVATPIAEALGAEPAFPFGGPPHHPFLAWAAAAEPVFQSPIGLSVHARAGLWRSWRAALLFARPIELGPRDSAPRPCDACAEEPCLSACPVDAFASGSYDVAACAAHLKTAEGADCMALGCRARRACPAGRAATPPPARAAFHMRAFLAARG